MRIYLCCDRATCSLCRAIFLSYSVKLPFRLPVVRMFADVAADRAAANAVSECPSKPNRCFALMFCEQICRRSGGPTIWKTRANRSDVGRNCRCPEKLDDLKENELLPVVLTEILCDALGYSSPANDGERYSISVNSMFTLLVSMSMRPWGISEPMQNGS